MRLSGSLALALVALVALVALFAAKTALAQPGGSEATLSINQGALEQLAPAVRQAAPPQASPPPVVHREFVRRPRPRVVPEPLPLPPPVPPAVLIPAVAPPPAKSKPAKPVPAKPVPPPRPKPSPVLTLVFPPAAASLPQANLAPFCAAGQHGIIVIGARAPAESGNPSGARRLSLARALAVRQALIACGVPSFHILPRAMGSAPGADPNTTYVTIAGGDR
jgi:outer membrane biosynthesis protein TonB